MHSKRVQALSFESPAHPALGSHMPGQRYYGPSQRPPWAPSQPSYSRSSVLTCGGDSTLSMSSSNEQYNSARSRSPLPTHRGGSVSVSTQFLHRELAALSTRQPLVPTHGGGLHSTQSFHRGLAVSACRSSGPTLRGGSQPSQFPHKDLVIWPSSWSSALTRGGSIGASLSHSYKTYPLRSHSGDRAKQLARPPWSARAPTRTRSSLHETVAKCSFSVGSVQDRHWPQQGVSMSADLSSTDKELHIRKPDVGKRSSCDAELDHTILTDLLTDAKCSPSIHQLLNVPWSPLPRIHAPPPRAVYEVLLDQNRSGQNIGMLLDQVSRSRAAYSVRDSSQSTYASHLRTICLVCSLLKVPVVPTNLLTIRRYTGVCNNPVTLRGHLAAWKLVHIVFGEPWPGDRDPFIRAVQAGIVRLQPPKSPKMAVRIDLCEKIVRYAFSEIGQDQSFGIMASLAYLFALRVPSELLRQGGLRILHWHENTWTYGPVIRKGSSTPTFIRRRCICNSKYYLMCPHYWWNQFRMISVRRQKPFTAWTCNSFNQRLREVLVAVGIQPTQAGNYTSHDFRRGCAKDILAQTGLQAMMSHCGWKSLGAAHHYVSKDEVDEAMLATLLAEGSDEDV